MSSYHRKPAQERKIVREVAKALADLQLLYPSNPADTKLLFLMANVCHRNLNLLIRALNGVVSGPHADVDYIEDAMEDVMEAAERIDRELKGGK